MSEGQIPPEELEVGMPPIVYVNKLEDVGPFGYDPPHDNFTVETDTHPLSYGDQIIKKKIVLY